MGSFKDRLAYGLIKHLVPFAALTAALSLVASHHAGYLQKLNASSYYQALVTFVTGSMIAIFLAVFYSDSIRAKFIQKHKAALTLYMVILLELIALVTCGLFVRDSHTAPLCIVLITLVMLDITSLVARLIAIALKVDNTSQ